ncbi:MAG: hypothetical protein AVDCRST_MAG13-2576 [uncultured Solirubrobacteraceae bacterium]|uniref:Uncharacterized protein n=1 Tax=uncultured Solirubrobacteraceae bacterium TaxID=1162706 RepID=A0A6J4SVY2_9ACTN|nr:MAG: hypothetical protein AVDCRST_MAG13-2576 [uncultured Solirubrobacteraceae bacterium]
MSPQGAGRRGQGSPDERLDRGERQGDTPLPGRPAGREVVGQRGVDPLDRP